MSGQRYPTTIELPLQWGEMDSFGHANNVIYARWFESCRIAWFEALNLMKDMPRIGPIMARQTIDYRIALKYPDRLLVSCGLVSIGRSSFNLKMIIRSKAHDRAIGAEAENVIVMLDYSTGKSVPLSEELRKAMLDLQEKAPLPGAPETDA
jgi:acyl-CoA thioester hydrolase